MADQQGLIIPVGADISDLDKGLGKGAKAVDHFADQVGKAADKGSKALAGVGKAGGFLRDALSFAAGGAITAGIGAVTGAVTDFFAGGIAESQGWNAAMAQTEAVIKSTGGAAGLSAQQMGDLAASLSGANGVSLASDDAILAGENLLATFTNIGANTFPKATATMVDMAQAMGTDVKGGAIQLGKALNDPIAGIGALSRVGVTFTDQQKEMIKTMVQAGDVEGAQGVILGELNKEFGGSAAAAAQADGGMFQLGEQMANVKQTVGDALLPIMHELAGFIASPAVMGTLQGLADLLAQGLTGGFGLLKDVLGQILPPIQAFGAILAQAFGGELKLDTLQALPGFLQPLGAIVGTAAENIGEFFRAIQSGADPLASFAELIKNNFLDLLPKFGELLAGIGQAVLDALPGLLANLGQLAGAFVAWVGPQIPVVLGKLAEWAGALAAWLVQTGLPTLGQALVRLGGALVAWIGDAVPQALHAIADWGQALFDWIGTPGFQQFALQMAQYQDKVNHWILDAAAALPGTLAQWGGALLAWLQGPEFQAFAAQLGVWGGKAAQWIADAIPPMLGQLAAWGGQLVGWLLTEGLPKLIGTLAGWTVKLVGWIIDSIPGLLTNLGTWAGQLWDWITNVFTPTGTANMGQAGGDIIQGLVNGIGAAAAGVVDAIGKIWTNLSESFSSAAGINSPSTVFFGFGSNIIAGLVNALLAGQSAVLSAITSVANTAITQFKALLGISSPSEETASIGGYLIEGLVGGLTAGQAAVAAAFVPLAELVHAQATLQQEGSMAYWWAGAKGLIPLMERKVDQGSDSLKAYMGPAWHGVFEYIGAEWATQIPALQDEWRAFLQGLVAATQAAAQQIAAILGGVPALPGGGAGTGIGTGAPGPGGTPNPGAGGGGGGSVTANTATFGAATGPVPQFDITLIAQFPDGTQAQLETQVASIRYHTAASVLGSSV